jgi:2-acylglycerol O-acyltransferase 2
MELVIKKRVGIFKIALETGTPIVPVLTYGENEVFPGTENEVLKWFNDKVLYDFARLQYPFPSLKALKNWMNLLVRPLDTIHTYTGKPIHVKKIESPSDEHIACLRRVYIREIRRLFKETNPGDFTLKIV